MQYLEVPCTVKPWNEVAIFECPERGQMSLPATARRRWELDEGGRVGYLDLGDAVVIVPGGVEGLRGELLASIDDSTWATASATLISPISNACPRS